MIIRLKDNSIRIRLDRTEVNHVCFLGKLEGSTKFADKQLSYCLKRENDALDMSAHFNENTITVILPGSRCDEWVNTNLVGFNHIQKNKDGSELSILVEKNFACLDTSNQKIEDNFENPNAIC